MEDQQLSQPPRPDTDLPQEGPPTPEPIDLMALSITERRLWDWKSALALVGWFGAGYVLISCIQVIILLQSAGGWEQFIYGSPTLQIPFSVNLITFLGLAAFALSGVLGVGLIFRRYSLAEIGFGKIPWMWTGIGAAVGIAAAVVRLSIILGFILILSLITDSSLLSTEDALTQLLVNTDSTLNLVLSLLMASVLVPLYEELYFRGFLHNWLRNYLQRWLAILISSFIFGLVHLIPIQAVMAMILGVPLAWIYERSDSLWPSFVLHMTNNLIAQSFVVLVLLFADRLPL